MIIDTDEVGASCLFCPYSVDKKHWTLKPLWSSLFQATILSFKLSINEVLMIFINFGLELLYL
jgi:hypothetical protein